MKRTVSAGDARKRLGELLEGVFYRGDEVIIERAGKPMAAVIPMAQYRALQRSRDELFDIIERIQEANRGVPAEEIEADIDAAVREVREARHATARAE